MKLREIFLRMGPILSLIICLALIRFPTAWLTTRLPSGMWLQGVWFVICQAMASILPIPAEPVMTACLRAAGAVLGTVENWLGTLVGGMVLFLFGRLAAPVVCKLLEHPAVRPTYERIERRLNPEKFWTITLVQFLPFPFLLVNLLLGTVSDVSVTTYILATAIAITPYQIVWSLGYLGVLRVSHLSWLLVGVTAFVLLAVMIYRLVKRRHRSQ
ncbi:TVP38/TMEM64 family protein [Alicyclobacillus suci]|uniref:TVP38/TMEM64 family protein n=1 Tax=Alicyclobacillus suci TaxID=2816080 RepID=UPI001A908E5C|nr:VTT domain-containing protein [Alicyclobacillus suci]